MLFVQMIVCFFGSEDSCRTYFVSQPLSFFFLWQLVTFAHARDCDRSEQMNARNALLLVLCALLFGYLVYALLKPEKF